MPRLEAFLGLLPRDLTHVFEFRHSSWHIAETAALLAQYGASPVTHDFPAVASPRWAAGPVAYIRFHGGTGKYVGRYPRGTLEGWAEWIMAQSAAGRPVWAFFNNDIEAAAIADALSLKTLLAQR